MTTTGPLPAIFSGAVGEQLLRRLEQSLADAEGALGHAARPSASASELDRLRGLIASLCERVDDHDDAHDAVIARLRARYEGRFDALARARVAVAELREVTSPGAMLARAPAALGGGSRLRRTIVSVVRDGAMFAEAVHLADEPGRAPQLLEQLRAVPVKLEHPLIETELLRRRRATIVVDAHVHPRVDRRMTELIGWEDYVAAPLLAGHTVIGVIHGDRGAGQPLDVLDRDVLWEFAAGLSQAHESATLRRMLRHEREQMRRFLEWVSARSSTLTDAPITLGAPTGPALPPPEPLDDPLPPEGRDDRIVFAGILTRRELDVLRLLADGLTNRSIADGLVVSEATVKFHVNGILRKLDAANRAEAVTRYLALLGMAPP